ncbi:MAG: HigA family addiction module antitoxin [Albidovulum sp.]|nr:HigA family addiction module antitoxin [Albidovulum sp.]
MNSRNGIKPVHPGEVLRDELDELRMSASALSKALDVPVNRMTMNLNCQRGVSTETPLRVAQYFGTTPQLWLNLKKTWELRNAETEAGRATSKCVKPRKSTATDSVADARS